MRIGELSKKSGCPAQTIRFYEKRGLISKPGRSDSNYRLYSENDLTRLRFICRCRKLDMSLKEIRQILDCNRDNQSSCSTITETLDKKIQEISFRMSEMKALKQSLTDIRQLCTKEVASSECEILNVLKTEPSRAG